MEILDLFAGKGGELRRGVIEARGHKYTTLDIDQKFGCTITADIMKINDLGMYDLVWASVPCETWSVASVSHHWDKETRLPKSENAKYMVGLVKHTLQLLEKSSRLGWVLENPVGMLRKQDFMSGYFRQTVHYCQYGENRMKPTDLWTSGLVSGWTGLPVCKRGASCHEAAPRGSKTGTQGMKNYADKSVVPVKLWESILDYLEGLQEK